jgi:signal transduction histidine kinase
VVGGSLWGLVAVLSTGPVSLPPDTEPRLAEFTEPLEISDDGVGGADLSNRTGLLGLRDRVEALGGSLVMKSPAGEGTSVLVRLPVDPA